MHSENWFELIGLLLGFYITFKNGPNAMNDDSMNAMNAAFFQFNMIHD